jgi:hypothetical protein
MHGWKICGKVRLVERFQERTWIVEIDVFGVFRSRETTNSATHPFSAPNLWKFEMCAKESSESIRNSTRDYSIRSCFAVIAIVLVLFERRSTAFHFMQL